MSGPCLPGVTSHDSLRVSMRSVRRPDLGVRAMAEPGRDPARLPSSFFTMSNSLLRGLRRAASLVPAAHVLRPGCHVRFVSSHLRCLRRPLRGLVPETLVVISSDPEPRGRRSAGRRTTLNFVAPVRRDATLARRSRPAQPGRRLSALHRGVCPKPAASPALPEPGQGWLAGHCSWAAASAGRVPSAVTSREPDATSPLRLLDRLRKTPLTSEDGNLLL